MLAPSVALSDLWPADAMVVQRPADDSLDWLRSGSMWPDRSSATPISYAGRLPIVCHEAAVRPAALQLLRDSGLRLPSEILSYADFDGMCGVIAHQVQKGRRLGITYSSRWPLAAAEAYLNHPETLSDLNDKANLGSLLPPEAVPERRIVAPGELAHTLAAPGLSPPFVLKAASRLGSGGGADVLICRTQEDVQEAERKFARAERVVVEAFYDFTATWCVHFAIGADGVRFCGAAEQVCDAGGMYYGNWCGPDNIPGPEAIELGRHAALAGWSRGYRGFLGMDVGRTGAGRYVAFDLNFRNNGSTPQVVLGDAVADAWGTQVTRLGLGLRFGGPFDAMLDRLWAGHVRRELIPLLAFDTPRLEADTDPPPMCNVLLAGHTPEAVGAILADLGRAGFVLP